MTTSKEALFQTKLTDPESTTNEIFGTNIPSLRLQRLVFENEHTRYYKANMGWEKTDVLALAPKKETALGILAALNNHYAVAQQISGPNILRPIEILNHGKQSALISEWADLEFMSSEFIDRHLSENPKLDREKIAVRAVKKLLPTIHEFHKKNVILRDFGIHSFMISTDLTTIRICDLRAATSLKNVRDNQNVFFGAGLNLAYTAPEVFARGVQGIDFRTDYYSLGVLMYYMISGRLPIQETNPHRFVAAHRSNIPEPLKYIEPGVSAETSRLIELLLSKDPDLRPESVDQLACQLENCSVSSTKFNSTTKPVKRYPQRNTSQLVGRNSELSEVSREIQNIGNGSGSAKILWVKGAPGIGKTALIREAIQNSDRFDIAFASGKFDQLNRDKPLSGVLQALENLIQIGLELGDNETDLAQHLRTTLGAGAGVLAEHVSNLEALIGPTEPPSPLSGDESANRLNYQITSLLKAFSAGSRAKTPIILFLDDLQWADHATIQLLRHLSAEPEINNVMIIGAYRDNEVPKAHPLHIAISSINEQTQNTSEICLSELSDQDIAKLVSNIIGCETNQCKNISELVLQYSSGNPFFTTRFLEGLIDRKIVIFDDTRNQWVLDEKSQREFHRTEDIVQFIIDEVREYPKEIQKILTIAASLGNEFDLETLSIAAGMNIQQTAESLWMPMIKGHILPESNLYKFVQPNSHEGVRPAQIGGTRYKFLHDRIQQAAYESCEDEDREVLHLMIARRLLSRRLGASPTTKLVEPTLEAAPAKAIYQIAHHYNCASEICKDPIETANAAKISLMAAIIAKSATAYDSATKFSTMSLRFASKTSPTAKRKILFRAEAERTEIFLLNADYDLCYNSFEKGLALAEGPLEKGRLYAARVQHLVAENQLSEAIDLGFKTIESLGFRASKYPEKPEDWPELPSLDEADSVEVIDDPKVMLAQQIIMCMTPAAFITSFPTYVSLVITMINFCREYGHTPFAPISYTNYGLVLSAVNRIDDGYQASQISLRLVDQLEASAFRCKVHTLSWGFIRHWKHSNKESQYALLKAFEEGIHLGDVEYAGYAAFLYCDKVFFGDGSLTELSGKQSIFADVTRRYGLDFSEKHVQVWASATEYLLGSSMKDEPGVNYSNQVFDFGAYDRACELEYLESVSNHFSLASGLILRTYLSLVFNDVERAYESCERALSFKNTSVGLLTFAVISALRPICYMRKFGRNCSASEKEAGLALVVEARAMLDYWSSVGDGIATVLSYWLNGEECFFLNDIKGAERELKAAIAQSEKNGSLGLHALLAERLSTIYGEQGKAQRSKELLQLAYQSYIGWGATAKAQLIRPKHSSSAVYERGEPDFTRSADPGGVDFSTVSQSLIEIGRETEIGPLLERIVSTISRVLGARHGFIFVQNGMDQQLVARFVSDTGITELDHDWSNTPERIVQLLLECKKTGTSVYLPDHRLSVNCEIDEKAIDARSVFVFPLVAKDRSLGAIILCNNLMQDAFSGTNEEIVDLLLTQSSTALNNAELLKERETEAKAFKSLRNALEETAAPMNLSNSGQNHRELVSFIYKLTFLIEETLGVRSVAIDILPSAFGGLTPLHSESNDFMKCTHRFKHILTYGNEDFGFILLGDTRPISFSIQQETIIASFGNLLVRILETNRRMRSDSALRGVFDGMNQGVRVFDSEGKPLVENERALSISELVKNHPDAVKFQRNVSPDLDVYLEAISLAGERLCSQDDSITFDLQVNKNNWQRIVYRGSKSGQSVILNSDITAERELEGQLRRADRLSALGTLAGSFAHDFNNFLHVLTGGVEILGQQGLGEETQKKAYGITQEAINSASELVSKLLLFGRRKSLEQRVVNIRHEMENLKASAESFSSENITFDFEKVPPNWNLRLDVGQFRSALLNVTKNAIEAMPNGGTLSVRVEQGIVPDQGSKEGIKISIRDTGKGVAEKDKEHLFDPFFSTRLDSGGNGLGLAAVYGFVTKCGGYIDFESVLGKGTCFHLWFPFPEKSIDINAPIQYFASKQEALKMKLLVVDDLPVLLEVLAMQLSSFGHEVFVAASAEEALTQLEAHRDFDMVVSDINMPGENGVSLMRKCKQLFPDTKVVLISGENDGSIVGTDEADAVLSKPCKAKDLQDILQQLAKDGVFD